MRASENGLLISWDKPITNYINKKPLGLVMGFGIFRHIKDIQRFEHILSVLFEQGFGYFLSRTNLIHKVPLKKKIKAKIKRKSYISPEVRLRKTLERLGPTFIKFGQLLSVRPDLVPISYAAELEKLQDHVEPFSYNEVGKIVKAETGKPIKKAFRSFQKKPIASASISQVHKATLKTGETVAVKVQRPGVSDLMSTDIEIMRYIANLLEKKMPEVKKYKPTAVINEFSEWTKKELDFRNEASNAVRFYNNSRKYPSIVIPEVYHGLCTKKILTLEYLEGIDIRDSTAIKTNKIDMHRTIKNGFDAVIRQIFVDGFFHADPHPGNILVLKNNKIAFVDFGIVGHFSDDLKRKAVDLFNGVVNEDPDKIVAAFLDMGLVEGYLDENKFKQEILAAIQPLKGASLKDIKVSNILEGVLDIALENNIRMPVDFVLFGKTILTLEGIALKYDPGFNFTKNVEPFVKELEVMRYDPKYVVNDLFKKAGRFSRFIQDFPDETSKLMRKMQEGKIKFEIEDTDIKTLSREIDRSSNRIAYGMIIAALLIAGALTLQHAQLISYSCFVVAASLGFILLVSIIRERRVR